MTIKNDNNLKEGVRIKHTLEQNKLEKNRHSLSEIAVRTPEHAVPKNDDEKITLKKN